MTHPNLCFCPCCHTYGDMECPWCEDIPKRCRCGGVIHFEWDGDYGEDSILCRECDICGTYGDEIGDALSNSDGGV